MQEWTISKLEGPKKVCIPGKRAASFEQVQGQVQRQCVSSAARPDWQELTAQMQAVPRSLSQRRHDLRSLHLPNLHNIVS